MNVRSLHWFAVAASFAAPFVLEAQAQEGTGDPFLDAMLQAEQQSAAPSLPDTATTPAAEPESTAAAPKATEKETAPAPGRPTRRLNDNGLIDNATVEKELGDHTALFGNDAYYDGKTVKDVRFRYVKGKPTLPDSRLYDAVRVHKGTAYSSSMVNDDLSRLITNGLVDANAQVAVEPSGDGVVVIFEVEPAAVMGGVGFTGIKHFTEKELREEMSDKLKEMNNGEAYLYSGKVINDSELARARAAILRAYYEAEYPDAKVTWRRVGTGREGFNDVIFDVEEGQRSCMSTIRFVGNKQFDTKQLQHMMKTEERGPFTWITKSGRIDREQLEDDLQEIIRHYRNYGYLRAAITNVEYTTTGRFSRKYVHMKVTIDEGPRYRVNKVSFADISVYTPEKLEQGLSMLDGDIYSLRKVSDDVTMIRAYYGAKGYADAAVRPDIQEVGVEADGTHLVNICYRVSEGTPYRVGSVNVRGNTKTKSYVILRELPLKPGDSLNSVDLETARRRLMNLGYFDAAEVSQTASARDGYRDINVNVHEKMTGLFNIGVAFSSIERVYLYADVTQSNFDIRGLFGRGSLVGGGQRLTFSGKLGTDSKRLSVSLLEPWFMNRKLALSNDAFYTYYSYMDYYAQDDYGYEVSLRKALNEFTSLKLAYRFEIYELSPHWDAPPFFRENCGTFSRSNLRISYLYDSRDAQITPRKGGHVELGASYSGPGSTVQTYNFSISSSAYYNSFWDSIFSINFAMETVETLRKDKHVPLFDLCYLGGQDNLRGFRYRDVGMLDRERAGRETMGGKSSAFVQFEMSLPVVENVRFAMFVDAGFVHASSFNFRPEAFASDYGFGVRINMPMGPLAVDYAIPLRSANAIDRNGQFQFYIDYKY